MKPRTKGTSWWVVKTDKEFTQRLRHEVDRMAKQTLSTDVETALREVFERDARQMFGRKRGS